MEGKLEALKMELDDCAYELVVRNRACEHSLGFALGLRFSSVSQSSVVTATNYADGFKDCDVAVLVGAKPRGPGMLRSDLLAANASIFEGQGKALAEHASADVHVLVVGNPCCTNALITSHFAPSIPKTNITALTRLDQNRCVSAIAAKLGVPPAHVSGAFIWGNHSAKQVPDARFATLAAPGATLVKGVRAEVGDEGWLLGDLVHATQQRGKAVIDKRGASSAGSAASAICDHLRDWFLGCPGPVSMAVPTDGSYGVEEGLVCSFPVKCTGGWAYAVDDTVAVDDWLQGALDASVAELREERAAALAQG